MTRFFRILFWLALAGVLFMTLRPLTVMVPGSDKTHHAITFGALMLIAAAAYPRARLMWLAVLLSGLGAAIELLQPIFGRSDDLFDWIADTAGVALAVGLVGTSRKLVAREPDTGS